jgi:hypothetical protein
MCKYCNENHAETIDSNNKQRIQYLSYLGNNEFEYIAEAFEGWDSDIFKFNFCPMCGRKL